MSYESLDLDINNYTISDLECFFKLNNKTYDADEVQYKEYLIREQLLKSGHVNAKFKAELVSFLESAKRWIIAAKCPAPTPPTSIPADFRLDPTAGIPVPPVSIHRTEELIYPTPIRPLHTTNGNQFYTGHINPIETRLKTCNICIDTLFRKNYTVTKSTDFTYMLPKVINNVVSLKLASFNFPVVWNIFSSTDKNNIMYLSLYNMNDLSNDTINFKIVIPDGNYTQTTIAQTLNNIFSKNSDSGLNYLWCEIDPITLGTVIRARNSTTEIEAGGAFPFDSTNGNVHYSPDFYFTVNFSLETEGIIRPAYKNLGWLLGFRKTFYTIKYSNTQTSYLATTFSAVTYNAYLISESFFGSAINNYLFVEVDDFQNNFPTDSIISSNDTVGNYLGKNIIARLVVSTGVNTILNDNGSDLIFKKRDYFGPVNLEKLKIRVLNRFGEVVNIGHNDYSMTFELTTVNSC